MQAVDQDDRRRRAAVEVEGDHLKLGEGATHPVSVDHWQAQLRGGHQRHERVAATDFDRHRRRHLYPESCRNSLHGQLAFVAAAEFLEADPPSTSCTSSAARCSWDASTAENTPTSATESTLPLKEVAAGINVLQLDEPVFNVYLQDVGDWGIDCLQEAIGGLGCKTAVHVCYGYGIPANLAWKRTLGNEWRQYEHLFPLLATSGVDQVSVECAGSRVPLGLLGMLDDQDVLVGCIDVATERVETAEEVAELIVAALRCVPAERLYPCTNCGMAPMARAIARRKLEALAAGAHLAAHDWRQRIAHRQKRRGRASREDGSEARGVSCGRSKRAAGRGPRRFASVEQDVQRPVPWPPGTRRTAS